MPRSNIPGKRGRTARKILICLSAEEDRRLREDAATILIPQAEVLRRSWLQHPHPVLPETPRPMPATTDAAMLSSLRKIGAFISMKSKAVEGLDAKTFGEQMKRLDALTAELHRRLYET